MKITKIISNLILLTIFGLGIISCADKVTPLSENNIIPKPLSVTEAGGSFTLTNETKLVALGNASEINPVIEIFQSLIKPSTGFDLQKAESGESNVIVFEIESASQKSPGEYAISIDQNSIKIAASNGEGLFNGLQTLRQLMPASLEGKDLTTEKIKIGAGQIQDKPEYAYRGFMLDVARHFFSVEDVKHVIDLVSKYKINFLHLHLSDDQGWRIEIKSWPLLTEIGGKTEVGGGEGGFYTQEQYKDIVAYAQSKFITIVPEIDMPGHTNSALAAYGQLNPGITVPEKGAVPFDRTALGVDGMATPLYTGIEVGFSTLDTDKEITYQFVDDVIRELVEMTPGPYIHIGGDESLVTELEDYIPFMEKAQAIVTKYGKKSIGWDEIAHAKLEPGAVAQYWAKAENAVLAINQGNQVLISPATKTYLDMQYDSTTQLGLHWAAYIELDDAYNWDPTELDEAIKRENILGVESPLWSETITNREEIEFMMFPRLAAIAEVAWTKKDLRNWDSFSERLKKHTARWDAMGLNYYKSPKLVWEEKK
ncbi:beta-N-acetylhexosaminidase [Aquiflexum sp. LQ15W]|uniref:beta-N-acetylhexosaminidase n=1 Tax=Cognataquiflexum nitidum TaxID=2922272 RepID=UPI001F13F10C|nr:beta-N-acetylhexosaminidase [Cognataquiflexum nitidum]MCH6198226.1 beta-N-acetylhexosaminidase [Cognataquiflexum nitidum]